jgi:acyl-CoA thioester hydrolase
MDTFEFIHELEVRDYELDLQGIVNNGVYQNYLEHVRHLYLKSIGIDFADYTRRGINLVVVRAELDYRFPLSSGDRFLVGVNFLRESRLKFVFQQEIIRLPDERPILSARIIGTALNERGRPFVPAEFAARLGG